MRTTTNIPRYTFASKERDEESGLSYFGARYYSSDLSIWLSVDPMSDKYPSLSPYVYCANNPVKLVDPNGEEALCPDNPPKNKSSMTAYYKQQITQTKGVEKFGYILKYTGEKIGFDEQEFVDKAAPYLETAASNLPIVSEFNNAKTIIRGEDMFDNKADISDKNLVFISVITKGANHSTKYITKKIQNEGSKLMNEVGNFGVRVQQSIKTYRNQKEKQKKYK